MVLRCEYHIFSTGTLEDLRPLDGIPHLRAKHGGELSVFKILAVVRFVEVPHQAVVRVAVEPRLVPLAVCRSVTKGRHRIDAPVNKDAEFSILEPFRSWMGFQ